MKKNLFIAILAIYLATITGYGQEKSIVPVSPEAAALSKMVNYPVNLYTGIPDISIPFHEIKSGELTLPITLQYHAGGFKVNEKSTRVGMGWNLSCDLQITREINGLDDFSYFPYLGYYDNTTMSSSPYPFDNSPNPLFPSQNIYDVANGKKDTMPDKFYYKLLNKSGSFFIVKNTTGSSSFVPVPYDNTRIEYQNRNFIITDIDGTKYFFGEGDDIYGTGKEITRQGSRSTVTAWKCLKIESNTGITEYTFSYEGTVENNMGRKELIEYYSSYYYNAPAFTHYYRSDQEPFSTYTWFDNYSPPLYQVSNPKYIEFTSTPTIPKLHVPYYDAGSNSFIDHTLEYRVGASPGYGVEISGLTLKEVTFRGGKVLFKGAYQLTEIEVKNVSQQTVKSLQLYQSYTRPTNLVSAKEYNGNNFLGTLYLDSLGMGIPSQSFETYKFLYESKYCFGNHLTGHDAWKYSNLSTREINNWDYTTTLPTSTTPETYHFWPSNYNDKVENVPFSTTGYAWALASNEGAMKRGVLRRIVYPTGGFVDFDFEPNRFPVKLRLQPLSDTEHIAEFPQIGGGLRIRSINFYEPDAWYPTSQKYYRYGKNENDIGELMCNPKIDVSDVSYDLAPVTTSQFVAHMVWPCSSPINPSCINRSTLSTLSIERKKMIYPASELDYSYGNGVSVFYTDVTEYNMDHGVQSGKTVYSFFSPKEFSSSLWDKLKYIPGTMIPFIKSGAYNAAQKSVSHYRFSPKGKYELVLKNSYQYEKFEKLPKIQVGYAEFNIIYMIHGGVGPTEHQELYNSYYQSPTQYLFNPGDNGADFVYGTYTIPVEKLLIKDQKEERYDSLGNVTTTIRSYTYDSYAQLSSTLQTNSKGETICSTFKYPYDFSSIYTDMKNKNMISPVIEEQEYINGNKTRTRRNNYKAETVSGKSIIVPSSIEIAYKNNPLRTEISFDQHDQYGNILQITQKDGLPVSYLWGYLGLYPVAELKGVPYSTIPAAFKSHTEINLPQNDAVLRSILGNLKTGLPKNIQMTGYTYKWLTGVSSIVNEAGTVSYYNYDSYGRLTSIKDDKDETIQSHVYNMPRRIHPHYAWSVNTPQFFSLNRQWVNGYESYSVILPGGKHMGTNTEYANYNARQDYINNGTGGTQFLSDFGGEHVKIELQGLYDSMLEPSFTNGATVDFLQEGSIVYSVEVPFRDMFIIHPPLISPAYLYVKPGTYDISVRFRPDTRYIKGTLPVCTLNWSNKGELNWNYNYFNSLNTTASFSTSKNYSIIIQGLMIDSVTQLDIF